LSEVQRFEQLASVLYSAVLADILDSVGARRQTLSHEIHPVLAEGRMVGRAATLLMQEVSEVPAHPYALELELLDDLRPGDVVVISTQNCTSCGVWGELLATHARARGARGAVTDGLTRDTWGLVAMGFPTFARGSSAADSKGRTDGIAMRQPVEIGGVVVRDGDIIFGDPDGCVAIPRSLEDTVLERALHKVAGENTVREVLRRGASIRQVFAEHGVL
jgi:regulator of RNase E activity RraA